MKWTWIYVCVVLWVGFSLTDVEGKTEAVRSCSTGWHFHEDVCYSYFLTALPWVDAGRACTTHDAQLVTILEEETQMFLQGMLKYTDSDYWLDLKYDSTQRQWRWKGSGNVPEYSNWASLSKPRENDDKAVTCGYMTGRLRPYQTLSGSVGMWGQAECNTRKRFICQKTPILHKYTCDDGWSLYDNMCFHGYQTPESWSVARQLCRKTHTNGDLLTIGTQDLQQIINSAIVERRVNYWVGLHYDRSSKDWIWLDIGKPDYSNWAPSLPDSARRQRGQECMYLIGGLTHRFYNQEPLLIGMWDHGRCESNLYFFCQKPANVMELPGAQPDILTQGPVRATSPAPGVHNATVKVRKAAADVSPDSDWKNTKVVTNTKYMTSSVGGGLAVVVAVVSGFVLVTVYLQRKGIGCFASKKLEVCKDPQNTPHTEDSDYATITDIMEPQEYLPEPHNVDHDDGANDNCPDSKRGISVTRTSKITEVDGYIDILDKGSSLKRKGGSCRHALTESKGSLRSRNDGTGSTYSEQIQGRSGRHAFIDPSDEDEEDEDVSRLDQGLSITTSHYLCPCQDEPTSEPCILYDFAESCGEQIVTDVDGSNGAPSVRDLTYAYEKMIRSTDNEYLDLSEDQDGGYEKPVHQQGGTYLDLCGEEDRSTPPSSA